MTTYRRGEEGAVAVVAGVSLVAILLMAAFILDLGALRADRVASQSVGDMAAAAAAEAFNENESYTEACVAAFEYAVANLRGATPAAGAIASACATVPTTCDPSTPVAVQLSAPPYDVHFVTPVPEPTAPDTGNAIVNTLRDRMAQQPPGSRDGQPCQRFGVEIQRSRAMIFGGLAGVFEGSTQRGAVSVVGTEAGPNEFSQLIVLQRTGCQTLANTGSGQIRVFTLEDFPDPETGELTDYPGQITVDTTSTCGNGANAQVIDQRTSTNSLTEASGDIFAFNLLGPNPGKTFNPAAVSGGNLVPEPRPGSMITRAPVDHRFNCLSTYPAFSATTTWSPDRTGQPIDGCDEAPGTPAYVKSLRDALSPITTAAQATTAGWGVLPQGECNGGTGTRTPTSYGGAQRLFVDCPISGGQRLRPGAAGLQLDGFSHIIFRDGLVFDSGELRINGPTVVYVRAGGVDASGASLRMRNVFAYVDAPNGDEIFRTSGSSDTLAWQAPLDRTACSSYTTGAPPAACFAPLALWNNATAMNELAGNGNGGIIGTFYTPNALFRFRGSSTISTAPCTATPTWAQINTNTGGVFNLEAAQFFTNRIDTAGGASVRMCPSPTTTVPTGAPLSGLIR